MSLIAQAMVFEKYGARLSTDQLASFLGISKATLYNQFAQGTCPIKTYVDGKARFADFRDVAQHLDECRERAA